MKKYDLIDGLFGLLGCLIALIIWIVKAGIVIWIAIKIIEYVK